ncbi:MAG: hypothetical protein JOZ37_17610 [Actinobacteria bacterium]|nr:hypothetical protein [Actinomycetota bacterium]
MGGFARRAAAVAIAALALTACGKSATPKRAAATKLPEPTVPATAPTTVPTDPYAVPPTIDAAYLNKVIQALDHVDGDATRLIVARRQLVPEAARRLSSIYSAEEFTAQTNLWLDLLDKGLPGAQASPGDVVTTITRVIAAGRSCAFVEVRRDYSKVATNGPTAGTDYLVLAPLDRKRDPNAFNPTPWVISREGFNSDQPQPSNPCPS